MYKIPLRDSGKKWACQGEHHHIHTCQRLILDSTKVVHVQRKSIIIHSTGEGEQDRDMRSQRSKEGQEYSINRLKGDT